MQNYQYILEYSGLAVSVDAAWDITRLRRYAEGQGLRLVGGLYTHGHFDHVGGQAPGAGMSPPQGAKELRTELEVSVWIGAGDLDAAVLQTGLSAERWSTVSDGDTLSPLGGDVRIVVLDTPGHSAGGVSYFVLGPESGGGRDSGGPGLGACAGGLLLTGDTVFIKSVGRTDLPGASHTALLKSLSRLSGLPDTAVVLSGHSYESPPRRASLGHIRVANQWMVQGIQKYPPRTLPALPDAVLPGAARESAEAAGRNEL